MKKVVAIALAVSLTGLAFADIQAPPGDANTPVRKLSRGLANMFYGFLEIPATIDHKLEYEGGTEAFSAGIIEGADRAATRFGYGLFEAVNFRTAKYKDSYRAPYASKSYDPTNGYKEYPPAMGFSSGTNYVRHGQ